MQDRNRAVELRSIKDIRPYPHNPRKNAAAVDAVAASIRAFGFNQPIAVDAEGVIVVGHTRYKAARKLKMDVVPVVVLDDLTPEQIAAYRLADNKTGDLAEWDDVRLHAELLALPDIDMALFGFDDILGDRGHDADHPKRSMAADFGVPPFSVLDVSQKDWAKRKKEWLALGIRSEESREDVKTYDVTTQYGCQCKNAVSVFDPVLCELMYRWFDVPGGTVFDPFAGGSVRGVVAESLGHPYTGIELRADQVEVNRQNASDIGVAPVWHCDDSRNMDAHVEDASQDLLFTCPPYADLEVYSDDPADLSNKEYPEFLALYREIMHKAAAKLKDNRFAVVVVGEVRDKTGAYYNFVGDTVRTFLEAGLVYYNEIILATAIGTLPIRAGRIMSTARKIGKRHQNVLVFYKGNPREISKHFPRMQSAEAPPEKAVA